MRGRKRREKRGGKRLPSKSSSSVAVSQLQTAFVSVAAARIWGAEVRGERKREGRRSRLTI
jgi:hypothetical protein